MEITNLIQQLYIAYYGRPADPEGLSYWAERLTDNGGNIVTITQAFGNSVEFDQRFGSLTDTSLVDTLYQQILGRPAEAEGLAFYTGMLARGESSLIDLALDIVNGAQGSDETVIESRLQVAQQFTQELAERGLLYGNEAIDQAADLLAGVTATTRVDEYIQSNVKALLATLTANDNAGPGEGDTSGSSAPTLAVDANGNATAGGDLSEHDLSNVTGTLTLSANTALPNATGRLPNAVEAHSYRLVLDGNVDISEVAFSSASGTLKVDIYGTADIAMSSAQYLQIAFGQIGQPGTQQSIRFTDSESPATVEAHHYVEDYTLSNAGQTIIVGKQNETGGEFFGGDGDDTFIGGQLDESWFFPAGGNDTLDLTDTSGPGMLGVGPNEGDDVVFGFLLSRMADSGADASSMGFLGVGSADEAAQYIASLEFIDNGQVATNGLAASTNANTPVDMVMTFEPGGSVTFVDVLPSSVDLAFLGGSHAAVPASGSLTIDSISGEDLNALFGAAHLEYENLYLV
tara:strand:- start:1266 stop:2813 length:1548 start_codon:yes stop_codon:yes gene_type:complete